MPNKLQTGNICSVYGLCLLVLFNVNDASAAVAETLDGVLGAESLNKGVGGAVDLMRGEQDGINTSQDDAVNLHWICFGEGWTKKWRVSNTQKKINYKHVLRDGT